MGRIESCGRFPESRQSLFAQSKFEDEDDKTREPRSETQEPGEGGSTINFGNAAPFALIRVSLKLPALRVPHSVSSNAKVIKWTGNTLSSLLQNMCIDHGG